ncbi:MULTISPECIES: hypothetical protein [unclassified Colwellia]|uniref:hypothetical protein n=1 Tax=unclassified Colwellia TaxID=196834 RepID=UPI0015F5659B|nr:MULTISPECIES: hypothetical protein [unclassified Colwellia]MBA6356669.1 hypothetical protein [Colwellia sp. BRX8-3]MBA6359092.1 hypothetical protein [Colwellia sp. BRX8-6]MBA6368453.1 hypothetical protein [Colwellia sp. BRX8-5]MBA6376586.1 hypothetical protein [Colwellia sp. BRX8-2]MBA6383443.1 hypothetical protein [Colwellia sp. BRX10-9]
MTNSCALINNSTGVNVVHFSESEHLTILPFSLSLTEEAHVLTSSFPFMMRPRFKAEIPANSFGSCDTGGNQGGPGGPPP